MARKPRTDAPDKWHHVMNRTQAKRTLFENEQDCRFFLACVAREVRAGRLEVHAYALMLTHYHLLVRSPTGRLSEAMQRVQTRYSRWFNRSRKRDGPLVRGRFRSKEVETLGYRRNVVTYIHDNPVEAGRVAVPWDDEWTSAGAYAGERRRPRWLCGAWIDDEIARRGGDEPSRAAQLMKAFPSRIEPEFRAWVEKQLGLRQEPEDADPSLVFAGSTRVVKWTIRKARLADGTRPWQRVSYPQPVEAVFRKERKRVGPGQVSIGGRVRDRWSLIRAGLLRMLCGRTHREIGMRMRRHASTICRYLQDHRELIAESPEYALYFATVSQLAMQRTPSRGF